MTSKASNKEEMGAAGKQDALFAQPLERTSKTVLWFDVSLFMWIRSFTI